MGIIYYNIVMLININKDPVEETQDYNSYIEHRSEIIFLSAKIDQNDDIVLFNDNTTQLKPHKLIFRYGSFFQNRKHSKESKRKKKVNVR